MKIAVASLVAILVLGLGQTAPRQGVTIRGQVTDSQTGQPLAGARVTVSGYGTTTTGSSGSYVMAIGDNGLVGQTLEVRALLIGYGVGSKHVLVTDSVMTVDFALSATQVSLDEIVVAGEAKQRAAIVANDVAAPAQLSNVQGRSRGQLQDLPGRYNPNFNTEAYDHFDENPFLAVSANPLSTFSIDVDRASYSNIRRFVNNGQRPPRDAVRIEEMVNYFTYEYHAPRGDAPFAVTTEVSDAPWNPLHRLIRIGVQGERIETDHLPASNLVFLLDVSGSMSSPDKLPLLKSSFRLLVNELRPEDRVAIVVYAGAAGLVLPSTSGEEKDKILDAIEMLHAGGSTAGGAGIKLAYDVARENHIRGGNNRVILATDGDFNVGASSDGEMVRLIEEKRSQGTFLTVLGFGSGNLKDSKMEKLADHGNGNFAYIDNIMEARKVLVTEMGGTLLTIAKDVKIQVEFNPTKVQAFRLIGYENRLLAAEDFNDDAKDAGELGAGHTVTALYEIVPVGVRTSVDIVGVDSLRYQTPAAPNSTSATDELLFVKLRYKEPTGTTSRLIEHAVADVAEAPSVDLAFASAVAGFGMLLRDSKYCDGLTLDGVIELARESMGADTEGYRSEFVRLAESVRDLGLLQN